MFQGATQATAWHEQGNRYGSKAGDPRVLELYVEEYHYLIEEGDLWIKMDFIPMQIEDSKSLAQSGYAQKNEDVDALTVLIEERTAWS